MNKPFAGQFIVLLVLIFTVLACGDDVTNITGFDAAAVPDTPQNLNAIGGKSITLDWDDMPYACYNLYWNNTGSVATTDNAIYNVSPPYDHKGLIYNGTTYYYAVTAVNCTLLTESALSSEVSAVSELPAGELSKHIASDAENGASFGYSVSISGDYAIAGAPFEAGGGTQRGAAYVLYRDRWGESEWGEAAKLTASDAQDTDRFGISVSISGDYAIVGAYQEDGAGMNRGAAYVFYRNEGGTDNWGEVTKLTASDDQDYDVFGYSVSISGDYAVVGAVSEDGAGTNRGAAYVFYLNEGGAGTWGEVTKLIASLPEDYASFGYSVSINGDYAIVGASDEDGAGSNRGAAYVFNRNQGGADNWGEVTKLTALDAEDGDDFGCSVSISRDDVIVGARFEGEVGLLERGAAYVYNRNHGGADNWGEVTKLTASDETQADRLGISVSMSGDHAIVGAAGENGAGSNRGAAYVFNRNQGGADNWGEVTKLTASDAENNDEFGGSVFMSGDDIIVGAPYENGAGTNRGAAYVY
jgi:hypothetical protein